MGYGHPWFTDIHLLRFCRARKFDFIKVQEMWSNYMTFRRENDIDNILVNFPKEKEPKFSQQLPHYQRGYFGVDKIGRPIYVDRMGSLKADKVLAIVDEEWCFRALYHSYEDVQKYKFLACSDTYDRQILNALNIVDMQGFGLSMFNS